MKDSRFIRAAEIAEEFEISEGAAYRIIKQLNNELNEKGYITVAGRVNRHYYNERTYEPKAVNNNEEQTYLD